MASKRRQAKPILLYNLLLKEVSAINRNLPEDRKLSVRERRELISKKIYPKYKDQGLTRIRLKPLRDKLVKSIQRIPKKPGCDVLAIPPETFQDVVYYEIEQFIESILPNCIYIKIDAGKFGSTNIFNTRDFNYYSTGIAEITNKINEHSRQKKLKSSTVPVYNGRVNIRPDRKNDGTPDNYFLEMVLTDSGPHAKLTIIIPKKKKTKRELQRENNVKEYIKERLKTIKTEQSAFKNIKRKISSTFRQMEVISKVRYLSDEEKARVKNKTYKALIKKMRAYFDEGKLTKTKYRRFIRQIDKGFGKAKG